MYAPWSPAGVPQQPGTPRPAPPTWVRAPHWWQRPGVSSVQLPHRSQAETNAHSYLMRAYAALKEADFQTAESSVLMSQQLALQRWWGLPEVGFMPHLVSEGLRRGLSRGALPGTHLE